MDGALHTGNSSDILIALCDLPLFTEIHIFTPRRTHIWDMLI